MKTNIFIDTSIFIGENFFLGKKLEKIGILASQEKINIFITTIVDKELITNIDKRAIEVQNANKKFRRELENKYKIIKNIHDLNEIIFNYEDLQILLYEKYERFKEFAKIKVIYPQEKFDIMKILNRYFNDEAPFNNIRKKNEFPDAISLKIIEDYCSSENIKVFHLSSDKDFEGISCENIEFRNDFGHFIVELTKQIYPEHYKDEDLVLNFVKEDEEIFIKLIKEEIQLDLMVHFLTMLDEGIELGAEDVNISKFNIEEYSVLDITKDYVGFICKGSYNSIINQRLNFMLTPEIHEDILKKNSYILKKGKYIEAEGLFEMTLYYSYEYPYKVLEETIEFDEDERKVKSIIPV